MNKSAARFDEKLELVCLDQTEVPHKAEVSIGKRLGVLAGMLGEKIDVAQKPNTKVGGLAGTTYHHQYPDRLRN